MVGVVRGGELGEGADRTLEKPELGESAEVSLGSSDGFAAYEGFSAVGGFSVYEKSRASRLWRI